jgi:predicted ATPase
MSPEQSGVIKRNVDARSDIYSLGIMFYQILTGELPFKADTISALIHRHIASRPEGFDKKAPGAPAILERMVFKMIEKEPDKRYQSAAAIVRDIDLFLIGYRDFVPGGTETTARPLFRPELIARKDEMDILMRNYQRALKGEGGLCLLSGFAGSGKTRLCEELREHVNSHEGLFLWMKCYPAMKGVPFSVFNDLINAYLRIFKKKSDLEKKRVVSAMQRELGDLGEIIIRFNPLMEEILGRCAPVVTLENERENLRFFMTISRLFRLLGDIEKGLVILIDDLHWSDAASLALLAEMAAGIHEWPVLVVATYRSDESEALAGFQRTVLAQPDRYPSLSELYCTPLSETQTGDLVESVLSRERADIPLADVTALVFRKSRGNPMMTIEILRQLVQEKGIYYADNRWRFDAALAEEVNIPSEIVDILIKRMGLLDDFEKNILALASVFGKKINITHLLQINKRLPREGEPAYEHARVSIIDRAISLQLLERDSLEERLIAFSHDRIREALDGTLAEETKRQIHRAMVAILEDAESDDRRRLIFDIVYHCIESGDADLILQYGMTAGFIARNNYAYGDALAYYSICLDLLEKKKSHGEADTVQILTCKENIGDILLVTGELKRAIELYTTILPQRMSLLKQGDAYHQICRAYFKMGDWANCEKYALIGLRLFGENLSVRRAAVLTGIAREVAVHVMLERFSRLFRFMRAKRKEQTEMKIRLYLVVSWMYI